MLAHLKLLKNLEFSPLYQETLDEYMASYDEQTAKVERFDARLEEIASQERYADKVKKIGVRCMIDLVIIDTGVDYSHLVFNGVNVECKQVHKVEEKYVVEESCGDEDGHGTAVAGIIATVAPKTRITMFKIEVDQEQTSVIQLLNTLEYICENVDCDMIHMSLGITEFYKPLEEICNRLSKKNIAIISAFSNNGAVSYPAAFESVIGVNATYKFSKVKEYDFYETGVVNINTRLGMNRVAWLNNSYIIGSGISYSAAYITAQLCQWMENEKYSKERVMLLLRDNAINVVEGNRNAYCVENVDRDTFFNKKTGAVIPYNKEVHSLVNFHMLLEFELEDIYDVVYSGKVGKTVQSIVDGKKYIIKDYQKIDFTKIDTMVIGHVDKLSDGLNYDLKKRILESCLRYNVNVFCFDDKGIEEYREEFRRKKIGLYVPCCMSSDTLTFKFGKLYCIEQPILGVFGTSSMQGKFTLQLQLRKYFLDAGYKVGQIGTEPSAELFGMERVVAFGYNSTTYLQEENFIEYINKCLHYISLKEPDIIIGGAQSGTIPKYMFNVSLFNLQSIEYLLGLNPDGIVFCVNLYDEIEYIRRAIHAIENIVECKVIAIAISPLTFKNEWNQMNSKKTLAKEDEISIFKQQVKKELVLDSYVIGTDEVNILFEKCIDFFSS